MFGVFGKQTAADSTARTVLLSVDTICPSPWQPRRVFDGEALDQLAESIRAHGLLQPIAVRSISGGRYELIAGERRLRACRMLGQNHIKATILSVSEREAALLTMAENLQREDLGFFEEAEGYRRLIDELRMTQQQLADSLGRQQSTVANKLRLLRLPQEVRDAITRHGLTERHARALLKLHSVEDQLEVIDRVVLKNLNVSQTEELVDQHVASLISLEKQRTQGTQTFSRAWRDWRLFANTMKSAVIELKASGLDAEFSLNDGDMYVEMRVVVPKSRVR